VPGLLADYCRHRETAEKINAMIDGFEPEWLKEAGGLGRYQTLLKIRETEPGPPPRWRPNCG